jgi:3-methyladenine DNA glycosylase AlkD
MSPELKQIQQTLLAKAGKSNKDFFSRVIPGEQKIYGVKTPVLNDLAKQYKKYSFPLAKELWQSAALEERIIAIKILEKTGKEDPALLLKLFKQFSKQIDNWAVCDGLGMQFLRSIVQTHAPEIFAISAKLSTSKNFWQRRLSLVMIEWYTRKQMYLPEIKKRVLQLESDDEYYVKKAVQWIKRNFSKEK